MFSGLIPPPPPDPAVCAGTRPRELKASWILASPNLRQKPWCKTKMYTPLSRSWP